MREFWILMDENFCFLGWILVRQFVLLCFFAFGLIQ